MSLKTSTAQNVNDFLHVEFVFLLTAIILVFKLDWRGFFNTKFFKFFLKFKITLFTSMKLQNFKKDMKEVNNGIGMSE